MGGATLLQAEAASVAAIPPHLAMRKNTVDMVKDPLSARLEVAPNKEFNYAEGVICCFVLFFYRPIDHK